MSSIEPEQPPEARPAEARPAEARPAEAKLAASSYQAPAIAWEEPFLALTQSSIQDCQQQPPPPQCQP